MASTSEVASVPLETDGELTYVAYNSERFLQGIMDLIRVDLSEPYSIFTYRYFINNWPNLCFLALAPPENSPESTADAAKADATPRVLGTIVCKQDRHRSGTVRGYIAMLAVHNSVRKRGMGRKLVQLAVRAMRDGGCDEAVLETEVTNLGALRLYEGLGFVRDKRLHRYYLNGNDAHRLKVWFRDAAGPMEEANQQEEADSPAADGHSAADDEQRTSPTSPSPDEPQRIG